MQFIIRRPEEAPNPATYVAQVSHVESVETYRLRDEREEKVLKDISFDIKRGECWGIIGQEPFETALLLEIVGCVRPYGSGKIVLAERGMMRRKRRILPHVFFISEGDVAFSNLNTLEYLMFVTAHMPMPAAQRQAHILQRLLDTGLYYLTLVPIRYLDRAQKAVLSLLAASFTMALLTVFSVPLLRFDSRLAQGIREIAGIITRGGGALLLGSGDADMVQQACTHAAFLIGGQIHSKDSVSDVLAILDKRIYIIACDNPDALALRLLELAPELILSVQGKELHIYDERAIPISQDAFLTLIRQAGHPITALRVSAKTLENAYREVLKAYDL